MPLKLKPLCVLMDRRLPTPVPSIALGHTWASDSFLRGLLGALGGGSAPHSRHLHPRCQGRSATGETGERRAHSGWALSLG